MDGAQWFTTAAINVRIRWHSLDSEVMVESSSRFSSGSGEQISGFGVAR